MTVTDNMKIFVLLERQNPQPIITPTSKLQFGAWYDIFCFHKK